MKHDAPPQLIRVTYKDVMAFGYSEKYAQKLLTIIKNSFGVKRLFKHQLIKYFELESV